MLVNMPLSLSKQNNRQWYIDTALLLPAIALMSIGFVMVSSASFSFGDHRLGDELFFFKRHSIYLIFGLLTLISSFLIPSHFWSKYSRLWLFSAICLLFIVLIPGIGHEVNGSRRWLAIAGFTVQISELTKVATVVFLATYLQQHRSTLANGWSHFFKLMAIIGLLSLLLILEPDFGSVVVLVGTFMAMLFLGGARLRQYVLIIAIAGVTLWWLKDAAPYRVARITAFLDPWSDQFNSGYQLTQSLIAFGRGEWFGVGLGQSVQKMLYLPEAHTDFVFAIFAEEFGFIGVVFLIGLYCLMISRIFGLSRIAIVQQRWYSAFVLIGFGLLISGQTFINLGVNAGLLPTKGLTLPFVSYGGSSLIVCCVMVGMMLRFGHDLNHFQSSIRRPSHES
jgi:cell division protein FtsW